MIYYISDTHFGHENVISFDNRPFQNANEMDKAIIDNWNSRVTDNDTVYILGDLCYRNSKAPEWYLSQLRGHKHLIVGNHDEKTLKSVEALKYLESINQILRIKDNSQKIVLCHYPLAEWQGFDSGALHIYGHIHNCKRNAYNYMKTLPTAYNCGCPIVNYTPATLDELIELNKIFQEG